MANELNSNEIERVVCKIRESGVSLGAGAHGAHRIERGACIMEAIAWAWDGNWTDMPACVPYDVARLAQRINDAEIWESDDDRTNTLMPFVPGILACRGDRASLRSRANLYAESALGFATVARDFAVLALRSIKRDDLAQRLEELPAQGISAAAARGVLWEVREEAYKNYRAAARAADAADAARAARAARVALAQKLRKNLLDLLTKVTPNATEGREGTEGSQS